MELHLHNALKRQLSIGVPFIYSLSLCDKNYKLCPKNYEWNRVEIMRAFLKSFHNITNLIFGSSYPMSILYFGEIWKIECLLISNLTIEDIFIKHVKKRDIFIKSITQ